MEIINVTAENFDDVVLKAKVPVMVDFWAAWCGPCKMLSPIVDSVAEERDDVLVCKVNIDEESSLAEKFMIMSIPTIVVFKNGEIYKKSVGVVSKSELLALFD